MARLGCCNKKIYKKYDRKMSFKRSFSENANKQTFTDDKLKSIIHKGLFECWKEGLLVDVELATNDGSGQTRKAHRLVLASTSPYFRALFSPQHNGESKTRVELKDIALNVVDLILEYAYTAVV